VASRRDKTVAVCVINALYFDEDLRELHDEAITRYRSCKATAAISQSSPEPNRAGQTDSPPVWKENLQRKGTKAKQAQAMAKRFNDKEKYSSDIHDPTTLAKTRERYLTAIKEL
jgi:hypothetical protein